MVTRGKGWIQSSGLTCTHTALYVKPALPAVGVQVLTTEPEEVSIHYIKTIVNKNSLSIAQGTGLNILE